MRILIPIFAVVALICGCASDPGWKNQTFAFDMPTDAPAITSTNIIALRHLGVSPQFEGRAFMYRTAANRYEQDPYAAFLVAPDRALAGPIRAGLRIFGRVVEDGGALTPTLGAEVTVTKLYGDFESPNNPSGTLQLHFILYQMTPDGPGQVVLDEVCGRSTSLAGKTPDDLMAAWNKDLRDIMGQISSDYAKANSTDSR